MARPFIVNIAVMSLRKIFFIILISLVSIIGSDRNPELPFLSDVKFLNNLSTSNSPGQLVLCQSKPSKDDHEDCENLLESEHCVLKGSMLCNDLSTTNEYDYRRILSQYDDRPIQVIQFALEQGKTFSMEVLLHDTISTQLANSGTFAPVLTALVHAITRDGCVESDGARRFVVDLGCNLGLVSLIALANGCDVVCVEPIGALIPAIVRSVARNRFNGTAAVLHAAAGAVWQEVTVTGCGAPCESETQTAEGEGTSTTHDPSAATATAAPAAGSAKPPEMALAWGEVRPAARGRGRTMSVPLGEHLRGQALLLKVDVEGYEWAAAQGLNRWLGAAGWDHLLLEARHRPQATIAALLQGCGGGGRPRVRTWRERYYGPVEEWDPARLPLTEVDLRDLGRPGPMPHEDFWVTCTPGAAAAPGDES